MLRALRRTVLLVSVVCCLIDRAAGQDVVDWPDLSRCVGRTCSVRGRVVEQREEGPVIRLYFAAERRDVYVTLMRGLLVTWPSYAGHDIVATGRVDRFRGDIEMLIENPHAVAILDPATPTPPAPGAAQATVTPPVTPGEVERLRERIRTLEDRVRELEDH
jgi:hypothetical protein